MGTSKLEFEIRMYTQSDRMCSTKVVAASAHQALMQAMNDPVYNHYDKFGLVSSTDNNCHMWEYRPGTPRRRPRGHGTFASALEDAKCGRAVVTKPEPEPPPPPRVGPIIANATQLSDIVMKRVLPQLSPKIPFKAEDVTRLLPPEYGKSWVPTVRSAVLARLRDKGVIKKFSHFEYMRNAEYVDKKLTEEELPPPPKQANGHPSEAPIAAPPPPPPPPPPSIAGAQAAFTSEEKVDAVLLLMRALMSDDAQKKAKLDELTDKLLEIATELDSLIKKEQQAPMRFAQLLEGMRNASMPPPVAAPTAVVLS